MPDQKRILVVDDEPDFASIVQANLESEGYTVDVAFDGVQGLVKVKETNPDLVILDVMMPEKDGYKMAKELRNNPETEEIPIIMLTAVGDHVTTTRYSHADGMSMEADDYLAKPASAEQILQSVKDLLD
ncbi:MAG: response regulator [Deltaproteobacteria bacterium]|jgi:two-component system alkaline phosphatase synthesis response regulator PhoP|nr:response regulator [Deltaproteobacteria bacterium]